MPAPLIIIPLLTWLGAAVGKFLTDKFLLFAAYKVLYVSLITITLPIVLKNLINWMMEQLITISNTNLDTTGLESSTIILTGLAGYLASHLLLPDCIAILITGIAIRLILNFIPLVG